MRGQPPEVGQLLRVGVEEPLARRGGRRRQRAQDSGRLQVAGQRVDQRPEHGAAARQVRPAGLQHRSIQVSHVLDTVTLEPVFDMAQLAQHDPDGHGPIIALGQPLHKGVDPRSEHGHGSVTVMGSRTHRCKHQNRLLRVVPGLAQVPMLHVCSVYVE